MRWLVSASALTALAFAPSAKAANPVYWDKNNGTWDTSSANWSPNSTGGSDTTFATGNDVIFGSTVVTAPSLTITTTNLAANSVTINDNTAYTFTNGGTLTLGNATTSNTFLSNPSTSGSATFNGAVNLAIPGTLPQTYTINNSSSGLITFGSTFTESEPTNNSIVTLAFTGTGGVTFNGALAGNNSGNPGENLNLSLTGTGSQAVSLNAANASEGIASVNGTSVLNIGNALALQDYNLQMVTGSTVNFTNGITSATIAGLGGTGGTLTLTNNASAAVALTLQGAALGNGNTPEAISPSSATNINGLGSVTVVGVTGGGNNSNGGTETLTGVLSFTGAAGLNVANTGSTGPGNATGSNTLTLVLQGVDTYTGSTTVNNKGTLTVNNGGSVANSSGYTIQNGATLNLSPAAGNTAAMLNSASNINLTTGALNFTSSNTTGSQSETFKALALGAGSSTVTITAPSAQLATLKAGAVSSSFTRSSNGTLLIRGTNLSQSSATNAAQFILGDGGASLALVGTNQLIGGGTADATQALKIVPYFIGDTNTGGSGSNFVTYDTTLGLRVLTSAEDATLAAASTTQAAPVNASGFNGTVTTSGLTVNSLLFNGGSQTLNGSGALTVNSGAVAAVANNEAISGFSSLALGNGEGVITTTSGNTLTVNTPISVTSSGGLTTAGAGTLVLAATELYSGATNANQGTLQIGNGTTGNLAAGSGAITVQLGTTLSPDLATNGALANAIVNNGTISKTVGANVNTLSGNISGAGVVTENLTGSTLSLAGSNTYSGATTVASGTILQAVSNAGNTTAGSSTALSTNSALALNGGMLSLLSNMAATTFTIPSTSALSASSTINVNNAGSGSNGVITLNGFNLGQNNTTTLTVAGANGYSMALGALTGSKSGVQTLNVTTANLTAQSYSVTTANNLGLTFTGQGNTTFTGAITAASSRNLLLTLNQTGTVTLFGANLTSRFSGTDGGQSGAVLALNNGTLVLNNATPFDVNTGLVNNIGTTTASSNSVTLLLGGTNATGLNGGVTLTRNFTAEDTDTGVLTLGGQNTSGTDTFSAPVTLGKTTNTGKSVTLVEAAGGTVNFFGGILQNGTDTTAGISVNNASNAGTVELSGGNTYVGPTAVNFGTLAIGNPGSLGATAVTVGNGASGNATLLAMGNTSIGTLTGTTGVTVNGGTSTTGQGIVSLVDGTINTLGLNAASGTTGLALNNGSVLNFDFNASNADQILLSSGVGASALGTTTVNINVLSGSAVSQTFNLISAPGGGLTNGGTNFVLGATTGAPIFGYTLSLNETGNALQLIETANAAPTIAYYSGNVSTGAGTSWSATTGSGTFQTNFTTDSAGTTNVGALPGPATTVHFYTTNANTNNLATTLDAAYSINALVLDGGALSLAVSIASGTGGTASTLTIANGITVNSGAGALTISAPVVLGGAQSWTNNSANLMTVSGAVTNGSNTLTLTGSGAILISGAIGSGTGGLTDTDPGTVTLTGANSYTGTTTVSNGTLQLGDGTVGHDATIASPSIVDNAALIFSTKSAQSVAGSISGSGSLTENGTGTLTLTGTNSYQGATAVSSGTLQIGNGTTTGNIGNNLGVTLGSGGNLTFSRTDGYSYSGPISTAVVAATGINETITNAAGAGALTLASVTGASTSNLNIVNNSTAGAITINESGSGANYLGAITGVSGSTVNFNNSGTGMTTFVGLMNSTGTITTGALNVSGQTVNFHSGNWINNTQQVYSNLVISGATYTQNTYYFYALPSVNITAGTLNVTGGGQMSMGSVFGASSSDGTYTSVGTQSGGTLNLLGSGLNLGDNDPSTTATYTLSGGTINTTNTAGTGGTGVLLGSGGSGTGSAKFTLTGTGTLTGFGTLSGSQSYGSGTTSTTFTSGSKTATVTSAAGLSVGDLLSGTSAVPAGTFITSISGTTLTLSSNATTSTSASTTYLGTPSQNFVFNGGTLSIAKVNMTNLTASGSTTSAAPGTLVNAGGILAPGTSGVAGKTTLTGNYSVTSSSAALAIDLGANTQATAYQTGSYDFLSISGTAALGGNLNLNYLTGFAPGTAGNAYTIVQTGVGVNSLTGTFAIANGNIGKSGGSAVIDDSTGLDSLLVTYNAGTATTNGSVVLTTATSNTYTGATGSTWDAANAANWSNFDPGSASGGTVASGAIAQFADGSGTGTGAVALSLNSTRNIQGIQFSSTQGGHNYTINNGGSGQITLDNTANHAAATIADSSASGNANAVNVPLVLNSNLAVSVTNAPNQLTLGGNISETAVGSSLTKSGNGTLVLTGADTYTGATVISAGTLQLGAGGSGTSLSSSSTITDNGALVFNSSSALSQGSQFGSGAITGTGSLSQIGSGTTTLNAAETYKGATSVSSGALTIASTGSIGNSGGTAVTVSGGALNDNATNGITGTSSLTVTGGVATLAGANNYTGTVSSNGTTITGTGTVIAKNSGSLGANSVLVGTGGALNLDGTSAPVNLANTIALSGTGLAASPTGALYNVAGSNSVSGAISLNGNTSIGANTGSTLALSALYTTTGSAIDLGNGNSVDYTLTLTGGGAINLTGNLYDTNMAGALTVAMSSTGITTIGAGDSNSNFYYGLTTVTSGELDLNKAAGINAGFGSATGFGNLLVNGGTLKWLASDQVATSATLTVSSGTVNFNGQNQTLTDLTNSGGTVLYGTGTVTFTDPTWSGGTNTVSGTTNAGSLAISGGTNTIQSGGTLDTGYGGGLGLSFSGTSSPSLAVNSGGTLSLDASSQTGIDTTNLTSSTATISGAGMLALNGVNQVINVANGGTTLEIDPQIVDGGGSITKTGSGNLLLTGNSLTTYVGATAVNNGTLTVTGNIGGSAVSIASGATLSGTGTVGATTISGGGIIGLQNGSIGTLTVGGLSAGSAGAPSSFTFDIGSAAGSIDTIADNGTLTLSGVGGTTITIGNATGVTTLASGLYNLITYTGAYSGSLSDLTLNTTTLDGQTLTLVQGNGAIQLLVINPTSTTYGLTTTAATTRLMSGQSTSLVTTIVNTGTGASDTLLFTGLGASGTTVSGAITSGGPLANAGGLASNTGQTFSDTTTGAHIIIPNIGTTMNALLGGSATLGATMPVTVDVVANRVVTASAVNFGRVMEGVVVSGTSMLSTLGDDADFTRVTVGSAVADANGISATGGTNPTFNSASVTDTRSVGGTFSTAGNISGALTLDTTGEGLTGESPINVTLDYSADAVNNRTETATTVNLGRVLVGQTTASQTTTISSAPNEDSLFTRTTLAASAQIATGVNNGTITLGAGTAYQYGNANDAVNTTMRGVTGSFTMAGTQSGTAFITPTGEGLAGEVVSSIGIGYTVDPVTMRVITNGATTNLGTLHNGAAVNATSNAFTTSGTHDTTTDVTVAAGAGASNGLTISGGPTTFDGTTSSDTRNLSGNISNAGGGLTTGTFNLAVTGEGLAGEGPYSDVAIAYTANVYTGQSVWAGTGSGGLWGTLASGFGANWGTNQGSPGLDANFTSTDSATFNNVSGQTTQLVNLDGASPSLNSITFNAPATSYTLAQGTGGTLLLNGGTGSATVTVTAGNHTISAPVSLTTNTNVNVAGGQKLTFSGGISGAGGLTMTGAGTTVLSNANSYAGGTILSSGTLEVADASTLGLVTGPLTVAGGMLDLGGTSQTVGPVAVTGASAIQNGSLTGSSYAVNAASGTATVDAVLDGSGALTKTGASTLALNGANTYSGGTTIDAGTVAAGNLSAFGTGNVTLSGGMLATGNGVHQISAASYTQTGGTLVLNLTGTAAGASPGYEFLHVTGSAALGGALQVNVASPYIPTTGDTFAFVQAGSITGSFASVSTNLSSLSIKQQGAGVIIGQLPFASLPGVTYTQNELAIAKYVDASYQNGASSSSFQTLQGALNSLTTLGSSPSELPDAFSQLSPESFGNFAENTLINNAVFTTQLFDGYLASQRSPHGEFLPGNGQIDSSGLTVIDPSMDPSLAQLSCRLLAWSPAPFDHGMLSDTTDPILAEMELREIQPVTDADQGRDFNLIVLGNVVLAQNFSQADLPHADTTTGVVQVGADYRITPHLRIGAIFGFGHTDADLDNNGSKATVDSYSPAAYLSFADHGWYVNALGSYGFNRFTEDRHVSFGGLTGVAHGAPSGDQIIGDLDGGYDFHVKKWTYGPLIGMQYTHIAVASFTEAGAAPIDLQVDQQNTDSLRSRLGGHISYEFHTRKVILTPHLDVSWQHEFLGPSRGITSKFTSVGVGSFTVDTPSANRDSALIDGGLRADLDGEVSLYLDYIVQAGQSNYFGQSLQAGIKLGF